MLPHRPAFTAMRADQAATVGVGAAFMLAAALATPPTTTASTATATIAGRAFASGAAYAIRAGAWIRARARIRVKARVKAKAFALRPHCIVFGITASANGAEIPRTHRGSHTAAYARPHVNR